MINWFVPKLSDKEKQYVNLAIESGWISDGEFIRTFENEFSDLVNSQYALTVSNGTTALHCALLTLGIGQGDEVIVPGYCFAAPTNMVLAVGATPIFADVDLLTWQVTVEEIEKKITPSTKAIIVVHNYGHVADMPEIMGLAERYNLKVIEDVAEATYSKINNQYVGTFGDIGCYSFQATKLLAMGEGGAVVTSNKALFEKAKLFRNHGMQADKRYFHEVIGFNFRLTNLQAALGLAQLQNRKDIIENKIRIESLYKQKITASNVLKLQQATRSDTTHVLWAMCYYLDLPQDTQFQTRDILRKKLLEKGIETRPGFIPFSLMPVSKSLAHSSSIPNSLKLSQGIISLPSSVSLSKYQIEYIASEFNQILSDEINTCTEYL